MKKRRKLNTNKVIAILIFFLLLTLGTCFFLKSDFFYLKKIVVNNNEYLSEKEINNILNIEMDKNIYFYNLNDLEGRVKSNSYVSDCKIKRKIPNELIVNVIEKNIIGPLYNGKSYCYIDDKGKLVDEKEQIGSKETIIKVDYTIKNNTFKFKDKHDKLKLVTLYESLKKENILIQLKSIDFNNKSVINMKNKEGIVICLNKDNDIKKNIVKLRKILVDLQNRKELYGKIDLTYKDYVLYNPYYK